MESAQGQLREQESALHPGFILGLDGERSGAGERIQAFVEETSIPQPMLGILQALPNTALWNRLQQEQRLIEGMGVTNVGNQNSLIDFLHESKLAPLTPLSGMPTRAIFWGELYGASPFWNAHQGYELRDGRGPQSIHAGSLMNFVPTRPIAEIAKEYVEGFWTLYEPANYLRRCFQQCLNITPPSGRKQTMQFAPGRGLRLVSQLWHQGIRRPEIRGQFWRQIWAIARTKPQTLAMYLSLCAAGEHFGEYRALARQHITQQLGYDPTLSSVTSESPVTSEAQPTLVRL